MELSKSKQINIKDRTCYYFQDLVNVNGLGFDKISTIFTPSIFGKMFV